MNRRHFLKNGLWIAAAPVLLLPRKSAAQSRMQIGPGKLSQIGGTPGTGGGGGGNNAALVGSNLGGTDTGGTDATSLAYSLGGNTVTNGNFVFLGVIAAPGDGQAVTFTAGQLTKTAGTSTVGTIVLDAHVDPTSTLSGCAVYRIPVTGTGTITLTWASGNGHPYFLLIGAAEFTGINATPLGPAGTNTGTSATASSGSVSTPTNGVMIYASSEQSVGNWTRTLSDSNIYHVDTGASTITGIVQYKIVNSSPNTMTSSLESSSIQWFVSYAEYKTS